MPKSFGEFATGFQLGQGAVVAGENIRRGRQQDQERSEFQKFLMEQKRAEMAQEVITRPLQVKQMENGIQVQALQLEGLHRKLDDEGMGTQEIANWLNVHQTPEQQLNPAWMPKSQFGRNQVLNVQKSAGDTLFGKSELLFQTAMQRRIATIQNIDDYASVMGALKRNGNDFTAPDVIAALKAAEANMPKPGSLPGFVPTRQRVDASGKITTEFEPDPSKKTPNVKEVNGVPYVQVGPDSWSPLKKDSDRPTVWTDDKGREWVRKGPNSWAQQKGEAVLMVDVTKEIDGEKVRRKIPASEYDLQKAKNELAKLESKRNNKLFGRFTEADGKRVAELRDEIEQLEGGKAAPAPNAGAPAPVGKWTPQGGFQRY